MTLTANQQIEIEVGLSIALVLWVAVLLWMGWDIVKDEKGVER